MITPIERFLIPWNAHTIISRSREGKLELPGLSRNTPMDAVISTLARWGWDLEDLASYWFEIYGHREMRAWKRIYQLQKPGASFSASTEFFERVVGEPRFR